MLSHLKAVLVTLVDKTVHPFKKSCWPFYLRLRIKIAVEPMKREVQDLLKATLTSFQIYRYGSVLHGNLVVGNIDMIGVGLVLNILP